MLHWLRNIVPKRFRLLGKLYLLTSSAHMLLLTILFVGYKSQQSYALEIAKQLQITADTKIMFMPLYKTTQSLGKKSGGSARGGASRLAWAARPRVKERAPTSLISDTSLIKSKKQRAELVAKAKKEKNAKNRKEAEKLKKQAEKKELEKLKKEQELKKEAEKRAEKKIEPTPEPEKKEQDVQKPEEKRVSEPVAAREQMPDTAAAQEGVVGQTDGQAGQDVVYLGQQEYDALGMQTYLQQELSANWQPPQGIPIDAVCEVSFVVDWQGKASTVIVSKPSGALVYDISARSALLAMEFPDWARGKSFKITFKQ